MVYDRVSTFRHEFSPLDSSTNMDDAKPFLGFLPMMPLGVINSFDLQGENTTKCQLEIEHSWYHYTRWQFIKPSDPLIQLFIHIGKY